VFSYEEVSFEMWGKYTYSTGKEARGNNKNDLSKLQEVTLAGHFNSRSLYFFKIIYPGTGGN
jgi:hypothetical protein